MGRSDQLGVWLSIGSYLMLSVSKITVGLWAHSLSVVADGFNNLTDIFVSVVLLVGCKIAERPADSNHPFGHNRAESVAILIAVSFMVFVSINIWIDVIQAIFDDRPTSIHPLAFYISILSAGVMFCIYLFNIRLSKKTKSNVLRATALDNRSDALVSLGAAVGILGNKYGLNWIDPLVALLVGGFIFRTAIQIVRPAIYSLMDGFDQTKLNQIKAKVYEIDGIEEIREIRARYHGQYIFVEITIGVAPHLSVVQSHQLTEKVEEKLSGFEEMIKQVHIHVEPTVDT